MVSKAQIKRIAALQQKKYRTQQQQFIVEGAKMVKEAIMSDFKVLELIGTAEHLEAYNFSSKYEAKADDLKRISTMKTPPGIVAIVETPKVNFREKIISPSLYLENIGDPGNLGTILRTAGWFGINQIYCSPNSVDGFNPKVVQASMGAIFNVSIQEIEINDFVKLCKVQKIKVYGTDMKGTSYLDVTSDERLIILMGSESQGISNEAKSLIDDTISIPQKGNGESLNVAMAAGILMSRFH